jgi:cell division inhibitor SepF
MSKLGDWFSRLLGMGDDDQYDEEEILSPSTSTPVDTPIKDPIPRNVSKKKEVSVTTLNNVTVIVISPLSFDEAKKTVDHMKNNRPVVANFEDTDRALVQRFIDFVGGAIYSLDGTLEKITEFVFLFAPSSVSINSDDKSRFISDHTSARKNYFSEDK